MSADPQSPEAPVLTVRGLVAKYGQTTVLHDIDLTVQPGELRVILGGSGCGKSTLMKSCIGLLPPAGGVVRVLGHDLTQMDEGPERTELFTRIGVMFQYGALLGSLTIGENLALPVREHTDLPETLIQELVRLKLSLVELAAAVHKLPSELSGGMRKRVALARAMMLDPPLLFCDEPSAGLDPLTSAELDELLLRMRDRFGMALVVVTHELMSIRRIADRALMLSSGKESGRVIADGTLAELLASEHPEVRAFFERRAAGEMRGPPTALEALSARPREQVG